MVQNTLFKVSEVEIFYRPNYKVADRPKISGSKDAYNILMDHWDDGKLEFLEEFKILLLNRRNRVLGVVNISSGGISGTVADPKVIFAIALKACASGIILAHNHPSGETDPSQEDIAVTKKLREAGKLLDLQILDHLIISKHGYYSFCDEGI
ncbi:JAB domain-containing protein [Pedobacter hartonius]|uniref:DNA repair protein RadC n=1 Tax=Pedobacter hartonius TaxID=425514 RepID=A0A1H4DWI5_9SPHI|nr:JAB domain-containing protein [Pedobacter hartonius]SEA76562.1 DNA repair protein RadC [Pedobacter hartonius]